MKILFEINMTEMSCDNDNDHPAASLAGSRTLSREGIRRVYVLVCRATIIKMTVMVDIDPVDPDLALLVVCMCGWRCHVTELGFNPYFILAWNRICQVANSSSEPWTTGELAVR